MQKYRPDIKFESRLLTHFDNSQQLPRIFSENDLSVLPLHRGNYIVGPFHQFQPIPDYEKVPVRHVSAVPGLESATTALRFNESMGLAYAEATGILNDFTGEKLTATVSGRHSSGTWKYGVRCKDTITELTVNDAQIEVDGGYEGERSLWLLEAKSYAPSEFCLRQLYFPYRSWAQRMKTKTVQTVFAAIEGDDFWFFELEYPDPLIFEAVVTRSVHYIVDSRVLTKQLVEKIHNTTSAESEDWVARHNHYPFPQANSPATAVAVIRYVTDSYVNANKLPSRDDIAEHIGFNPRQADYYCNLGAFLGYLDRGGLGIDSTTRFYPTQLALRMQSLDTFEQRCDLISALMCWPAFRCGYEMWQKSGAIPDNNTIGDIVERTTNYNLTTARRRASSVRTWLKWLSDLVK